MNASRPQTVAAGIADSPTGQSASSELFNSFGHGTSLVSRDQILTQDSPTVAPQLIERWRSVLDHHRYE